MEKSRGAYISGILQGKAYRVLQNHLSSVLTLHNLSIAEWKLLGTLFDMEKARISDLAETLAVEPPLVTKMVKQLLSRGFITQTSDTKDKRATLLTPTDKTKKLIPDLDIPVRIMLGEILQGISQDELAIYMKVLKAIVKNGHLMKIKKGFEIE